MTNFLKNLQQKPEPAKKIIMWISVAFIMLAIFSFWLLTFPAQTQNPEDNKTAAKLKQELPSVWQTFKNQIGNLQNLWRK